MTRARLSVWRGATDELERLSPGTGRPPGPGQVSPLDLKATRELDSSTPRRCTARPRPRWEGDLSPTVRSRSTRMRSAAVRHHRVRQPGGGGRDRGRAPHCPVGTRSRSGRSGETDALRRVSAHEARWDSTALAAFIAGTVLAGGNAVGVRVSNRELDPLWGAGLRFLLAACLLGAVMAVMRLTLPRGRALLGVLLYGALIFGGAFSFAYYALVRIHAGSRPNASRTRPARHASARGPTTAGASAIRGSHRDTRFPLRALA